MQDAGDSTVKQGSKPRPSSIRFLAHLTLDGPAHLYRSVVSCRLCRMLTVQVQHRWTVTVQSLSLRSSSSYARRPVDYAGGARGVGGNRRLNVHPCTEGGPKKAGRVRGSRDMRCRYHMNYYYRYCPS